MPGFSADVEQLVALLLATVRTASFLLLAPPFSYRSVPAPVKALLALGIAAAAVPAARPSQLVVDLDAAAMAVVTAQEVLIGSALGFLCLVVFAAVQAAGDLLDVFGGFTLAFAFDPLTQTSSAVMGRTYQLTALTLLFATNAHLLVLRGLLRTFEVLPLGRVLDLSVLGETGVQAVSAMFLAALQIAGPLIAVLFLADVGLGLLTRVAPALNAFSLGFPLKIFITLLLASISLVALPPVVESLADRAVRMVVGVAGG